MKPKQSYHLITNECIKSVKFKLTKLNIVADNDQLTLNCYLKCKLWYSLQILLISQCLYYHTPIMTLFSHHPFRFVSIAPTDVI